MPGLVYKAVIVTTSQNKCLVLFIRRCVIATEKQQHRVIKVEGSGIRTRVHLTAAYCIAQ